MQAVVLNNGIAIPIVGYGVFQIPDSQECTRCVIDAIDAGYRLIDTAASYMNKAAVEQGVKNVRIPREQLSAVSLCCQVSEEGPYRREPAIGKRKGRRT